MKVLEGEAKALLTESGLRVPAGQVVTAPREAEQVARSINGPVVIKAQIPTGGRMKAGGVAFADTPAAAASATLAMLGRVILGFPVSAVLVEANIEHTVELFVGVTYAVRTRRPGVIASLAGGIDVEQGSGRVQRNFSLLPDTSEPHDVGRDVAADLGFAGQVSDNLGAIINILIDRFIALDAILLEVNPLILTPAGHWIMADVHLELDDDAAYRNTECFARLPQSVREADRRSEFERRALEIDSADHRGVAGRLVPFGGNLGLLIGGGGASLTIMDAVLDAGLKPANYCEIGGNPSVWKIKELTKLILQQPGVDKLAVMMNVVSNTRVDLVARGVIKGVLELGRVPREVITAFRIPGSWEDEGQAILRHYGIASFDRSVSFDQVVEQIARRV